LYLGCVMPIFVISYFVPTQLQHSRRKAKNADSPQTAFAVQAQPSGRAAAYQDFHQRSAVDVVAGRALTVDPIGSQICYINH